MKKMMKRLFCTVLVLLLCITSVPLTNVDAAEENMIPDDAKYFNGHWYKAYDISKSWTNAKAYCENLGGHLVTITSQKEQTFIENAFLSNNPNKHFYLAGGYRSNDYSEWQWCTGEEFTYKKWHGEGVEASQTGYNQHYIWIISSSAPPTAWADNNEYDLTRYEWMSHTNENYYDSVLNTRNVGFICEWENQAEYQIDGSTFNENIDCFTTFTDSASYNPVLANMTAALSKAVYSETDIIDAYQSLGFDYEFGDYNEDFNPYKSGHVVGFKKSDYNDDTVCLVTVRGSVGSLLTGSDWWGNYSIATTDDDKHIGFAYPANYIYMHIKDLIAEKKFTGNIKFVITGHSRGAAVANLLSVQLMELGVSSSNVYNYNFACPDVACKVFFDRYYNIFNLCNREDPVPFIPGNLASVFTTPGTSWGKFGLTYWFTEDADGTINPSEDHAIELYLSYFDRQLALDEWDYTLGDLEDDFWHTVNGWVAKILCPVDVIVTDADGNKIASVINGEINYYDSEFGDVIILTDGDKKVIYIKGDRNFNVNLIGSDDGSMTYSVESYNYITNEISESKTFSDVELKAGKRFYSPVNDAETTEEIELFVVEASNGEDVNTFEVDTAGKETEINHIYEVKKVEPTCDTRGYNEYKCINCTDTYMDSYVPALGHTSSSWITDLAPACSAEGSKHTECTVCEEVLKTEPIAKLPHTYNSVVTEATCESVGFTTYTCSCGDTYTGDKTPAKGHNYVEGICENCGDSKVDNCTHLCHKSGFLGFIWKLVRFIIKLFRVSHVCSCGVAHY